MLGPVGRGPVLGEQFTQGFFIAPAAGKPLNDISKVGLWIDSVMAGADEQAVENCAAISSFRAADKERVLPTDGDWAHVSFDAVVINLDLAVVEVGEDFFPLVEGIGYRLTESSGWAGGFAIS